jgi:hypothetical protein
MLFGPFGRLCHSNRRTGIVLAEDLESKMARGEQIDVTQHALLRSSLVRLGNRIGINRIARDVTPTLEQYLQSLKHARTGPLGRHGASSR